MRRIVFPAYMHAQTAREDPALPNSRIQSSTLRTNLQMIPCLTNKGKYRDNPISNVTDLVIVTVRFDRPLRLTFNPRLRTRVGSRIPHIRFGK